MANEDRGFARYRVEIEMETDIEYAETRPIAIAVLVRSGDEWREALRLAASAPPRARAHSGEEKAVPAVLRDVASLLELIDVTEAVDEARRG